MGGGVVGQSTSAPEQSGRACLLIGKQGTQQALVRRLEGRLLAQFTLQVADGFQTQWLACQPWPGGPKGARNGVHERASPHQPPHLCSCRRGCCCLARAWIRAGQVPQLTTQHRPSTQANQCCKSGQRKGAAAAGGAYLPIGARRAAHFPHCVPATARRDSPKGRQRQPASRPKRPPAALP